MQCPKCSRQMDDYQQLKIYECHYCDHVVHYPAKTASPREPACVPVVLNDLLSRSLRALCLTRDYVGADRLPAIDGWEWYEAGKALAEAIPDDEWAEQFRLRVAR